MWLLVFILGSVGLIVGAELLVRGASRLAAAVGVTPLVIGLTVVSLGTSAPEIAISIDASLRGHADIAMGNIVGSNIFNVLLILGLSALIGPLIVSQRLLWWDVPLMIGFAILLLLLGLDRSIGRFDGAVLCLVLVAYVGWTIHLSRRERQEESHQYANPDAPNGKRMTRNIIAQLALITGGLALLVIGAEWFVQGAVKIALALGISELVVSLTIVAAGTSLPEVVVSVLASYRGERDIAVGNVVGSNIFNILAVLGLTAVVLPSGVPVPLAVLHFDIPVMIAAFVACLPIFMTGHLISRWEGGLFVGYYAAYTLYVILDATAHDGLPIFSQIMLVFVLPLTVVTLLIAVTRAYRQGRRRPIQDAKVKLR
ncbi:MAG TPA: calcium/sodium antiporter [Candidatus Binatia bacterium]|nr:calcium/sodium antiporter [Candidatus Binatia bacterium]